MFKRHDNVIITAVNNPNHSWIIGKPAQIIRVGKVGIFTVYTVIVVKRNRFEQFVLGGEQMRLA